MKKLLYDALINKSNNASYINGQLKYIIEESKKGNTIPEEDVLNLVDKIDPKIKEEDLTKFAKEKEAFKYRG